MTDNTPREALDLAIGALADIAFSSDMSLEVARNKAKRIYEEACAALAAPVVEAGAPTTVDLNLWKHRILPQGTEQPSSLHWDEPERRDAWMTDAECWEQGKPDSIDRAMAAGRRDVSPQAAETGKPLRNDPLSALAIRLLVAAGHVSQAKADEAFTIACSAFEEEAQRMNCELPWVTRAARPPAVEAEPVRRLVDAAMAVATEFDIVAINRVWDAVYSFVEPRRRHEAYQLALAAMNTEAKNG